MDNIPVATAVPPPSAPGHFLPRSGSHRDIDLTHDQVQAMHNYLLESNFPKGLREVMIEAHRRFPLRIWIVDNSGSMSIGDGKKLVRVKSDAYKMLSASRWEELQECVKFHGTFACGTKSPTDFRLLNGGQSVMVGRSPIGVQSSNDNAILTSVMDSGPGGGTPLCTHVTQIRALLMHDAEKLRQHGQKVVVVLATDGMSTDGDLGAALKTLEGLPCWVVIRLCTDEDKIVDYYNDIDNRLELDMDVLDDLQGESKEVCDLNPWLVYAQPLHRAREFGIHLKIFDLLDERRFTTGEVKEFCAMLFGRKDLPHPDLDWDNFEKVLKECLAESPKVWNPLSQKVEPWINLRVLRKIYKNGGNGCSMS